MGYVAEFSNDVFISYSHIDDHPFGEGKKCWVTDFHQDLETRTQNYLGAPTRFWRDRKMDGVDVFSAEIADRLRESAVLVSIVSPAYLRSQWCNRELQTFLEHAAASGGVCVGNQQRIVKVVKTPVPREALPTILSGVNGYEFFTFELDRDRSREFHLSPDREARLAYWAKVDDVAQDLRRLFEALASKSQKKSRQDNATVPAIVYLAETTCDQQFARDRIRRELEDRGYRVVPEAPLPIESNEVIKVARRELAGASLSIHLIGSEYGWIPEGERRSVVQLQADVAAERSVPRFVWISEYLDVTEEKQLEFIRELRAGGSFPDELELVQGPVEELKTHILDKLNKMQRVRQFPGEHDRMSVYLVIDSADTANVTPLRNYLTSKGFEVALPLAQGDVANIRKEQEQSLLFCDAVLIYWGQGDEYWVRSKLRDLMRARGLGRTGPFLGRGVYIAGPPHPSKVDLAADGACVMREEVTFSPEALAPFMDLLMTRRSAAQ